MKTMYNTDMPTRAELPTSGQLIRSTILAIIVAAALLVTIVLPAEYNIDPTGVGRLLGLAEMGAIKKQLAEEAEQDRQKDLKPKNSSHNANSVGTVIAGLFISPARAHDDGHDVSERKKILVIKEDTTTASTEAKAAEKPSEMSVTLKPGQGAEIKLVMKKGAKAQFEWTVEGGKVNCDLHGDNDKDSIRYKKTRGSAGRKGEITAAFDGNHGWFWRNRGKKPVTVTIKVKGDYSEMKRVL